MVRKSKPCRLCDGKMYEKEVHGGVRMGTKECLRNGCSEPRSDKRGSAGRFCSDLCREKYGFKSRSDGSLQGLAQDIASGGSGE